jgi:hypothetical protein
MRWACLERVEQRHRRSGLSAMRVDEVRLGLGVWDRWVVEVHLWEFQLALQFLAEAQIQLQLG